MVVFDEMRGSLMWFIFLGLWSSWRNHKHKLSLQIYSFCSVLSECSSFYYVLKSYDIFSEKSLISIIAEWLYIFVSLTHLITSIESLVKSNVQVQLIQKLSSIDEIFKTKMNLIIPYRKEKREIRFRNIILASTIILMKIIVTILFARRGKILTFWYPSLFSTLISFVRSIQILLFIYLLRNRLKLVNKEVIEVRNALYAKANNDYAKQTIYFARHTAFNRILMLKMIYAELYEMCQLIRKTFGWSLLAVVTEYFLDFTFNCFWVFLYLTAEAASVENIIICFCLLTPTAALLGSMSFNCSLCYEYVGKIYSICFNLFS